jgi:ribose/xylose/arabinose/galactoside ABC-type transport system permease subunit
VEGRGGAPRPSLWSEAMGRWLITLGLVLVVLGMLWPLVNKLGLGNLPGDIRIERKGHSFYFPVTSSIIVSLVLTLILWIFRR